MALDNLYLASGGAQLEVRKQRAQENQANRELDIRQQSANDSSRRSYLDEIASRQTLEESKFNLQLKKDADTRRKRQEAIARTIMSSNRSGKLSGEGEDDDKDLYQKNISLAKELASVNPEDSNAYFNRAQEIKKRIFSSEKSNLELRTQKLEAVGNVAAQVNSTETAKNAEAELAKLGKSVPQKALDFKNPEAKDWWARQAQFSQYAREASKLDLDTRKFEFDKENKLEDNKRADKDLALKERKLQLSRDKIIASRNKLTTPSNTVTASTAAYMSEKYDTFSSANKEAQIIAARDVEALTLDYMQTKNIPQQEARQLAMDTVATQFDSEGNYNVPTKAKINISSSNSPSPKTQAEFNALPSGALYINPKDGKQYRKK